MTHACRIEVHPPARDMEFVAFSLASGSAPRGFPSMPGQGLGAAGRWEILHVAPGRWFAPDASEATRQLLEEAESHGAVFDVEGARTRIDVIGLGATRLLSESLDIVSVLEGRDGAAMTLFDCPAIVASIPEGYTVWVRASYQAHLLRVLSEIAHSPAKS